MNFFRRKKHPRAISFCLTTVLWAGHGEKDIRWTGKIIGTDSRGLFHCAHLSRTQHHGRLCAHNAACRLNVRMHAREIDRPPTSPRFPLFVCAGTRFSSARETNFSETTIKHDRARVDRDARISNENFQTAPSLYRRSIDDNLRRVYVGRCGRLEQCAIYDFSKFTLASADNTFLLPSGASGIPQVPLNFRTTR